METVPPQLRSSYEMLTLAFPLLPERDEYLTLLWLLHGEFSQRNLAELMVHCFAAEYHIALNDVYHVGSSEYQPAVEAVERIKRCLLPYGYEAWLKEE